jgi:equilibrative nucleoside transporter 1/2/3
LATDDSALELMHELYPEKKGHPLIILYVSITLVYALTLSLFPSLTGLVESSNTDVGRPRITKDLFVPFHFLVFNVGDWIGRALPSIPFFTPDIQHPSKKRQSEYLFSALVRLAFIPIFLTANLPIPEDKRLLPYLISSDALWFTLLLLFSISNGFISSTVMMVAPYCVLGGEKKSRVGVRMSFFLTFGLALGSLSSFGVRQLMCFRGGCSTN